MMSKTKIALVSDWRNGWRWFSSWALLLIIFLATEPLPHEVLVLMPEPMRQKMMAVIAVMGLVLRFVRQSKKDA